MTAEATDRLILRQPDDWHVHLRDGTMLAGALPYTARRFARAIVMPNLSPPVITAIDALAYRTRILEALPPGSGFTPLMTLYLTDGTDPADVIAAYDQGIAVACKLYPAHATTNSAAGVTNIRRVDAVLAAMEEAGMPLLVHGEVTDIEVDIFDREAVFIDRVLAPTLARFPQLRLVFEHITTEQAVHFVEAAADNVAATITPHHLAINRNSMLVGGIRPHAYCLPVAKRERHRLALRRAAVSGNPKFFLGTDSAPHQVAAKEAACGCAGIFNAPFAIECYAQVFDEEGALARLEDFASVHGARFYRLPLNDGQIVLSRGGRRVPERLELAEYDVVPWRAGETLPWHAEQMVDR